MKLHVLLATSCIMLSASIAHASSGCMMTPAYDTYAINDPSVNWFHGVRGGPVTQLVIEKKTGIKSFCIEGGSCYAAQAYVDARPVEALRLTNCRIRPGDTGRDDGNFIRFEIEALPLSAPEPPGTKRP